MHLVTADGHLAPYRWTTTEGSGARSIDLIEAEAKKSEASSSQTSEAAAPLIAKALRYLSDDKITDNARGDLFAGANILGFMRVANVMMTHGAL
jgi:hypothetical protein